MIEAIVVLIMIAAMATAFAPRFAGMSDRTAEREAGDVQRLLSIAGEKGLFSGQPAAIEYSARTSELALLVRRDRSTLTDAPSESIPVWQPDPLVNVVVLKELRLKQAFADGQLLAISGWRVAFLPGEPRPELRLVLDSSGKGASTGESETQVMLMTGSINALRTGKHQERGPNAARPPRVIDLDDAGKGTKPW